MQAQFNGTHARGIVVYREAQPDYRKYDCAYALKAVHISQLDNAEYMPSLAWPGMYEIAYYTTHDHGTEGPYCAMCAREMARTGNYYDRKAEESGGIMAECTDRWDCPDYCANCHAEMGPSMHCGPRDGYGSCSHCGMGLEPDEATAL